VASDIKPLRLHPHEHLAPRCLLAGLRAPPCSRSVALSHLSTALRLLWNSAFARATIARDVATALNLNGRRRGCGLLHGAAAAVIAVAAGAIRIARRAPLAVDHRVVLSAPRLRKAARAPTSAVVARRWRRRRDRREVGERFKSWVACPISASDAHIVLAYEPVHLALVVTAARHRLVRARGEAHRFMGRILEVVVIVVRGPGVVWIHVVVCCKLGAHRNALL